MSHANDHDHDKLVEAFRESIADTLERLRKDLGPEGKIPTSTIAALAISSLESFIETRVIASAANASPVALAAVMLGDKTRADQFMMNVQAVAIDIMIAFGIKYPELAERFSNALYESSASRTATAIDGWRTDRAALVDRIAQDTEVMFGLIESVRDHNDKIDAVAAVEKLTGDHK